MTETETRAAVAGRAARAGATHARDLFRTDLAVETKDNKTDVVTRADREAQAQVIETIRETYPEDAVVGEEENELKQVPGSGAAWVIDPIDGTNNYVRGIRLWCTAVAAVVDGDPVAAASVLPAFGDVYTADATGAYLDGTELAVSERTDPETCTVAPTLWWGYDDRDRYAAVTREIVERFGDMRRFGCAQATLAFLAAGSIDGVVSDVRPNPWDTVAGVHMVRQAGGTVTDLDGDPWTHSSVGLVASNGHVHGEVLAAARGTEDPDG